MECRAALFYWIAAQIQVDNERGFAQLVSECSKCCSTHMMEITADYRTGFTDKMRIKYHMWDIVQPLWNVILRGFSRIFDLYLFVF